MSKIQGTALIFDENEVKETHEILPRLIRIIFYGLRITNDSYLERYGRFFKDFFPGKTRKEFSQKSAADRKFISERKGLTIKMMTNVLRAMGYEIESMSVTLKDVITGDTKTFSTTDTIEDLNARIEKSKEIGISSLG